MSNLRVEQFDDETVLELFGAQAAEDENIDRLKSYFFRNKSFSRLTANIPLRIVVGHKGVGKSALLKMAYLEDQEANILSVWLRPNDIANAWGTDGTFVERVEGIKKNILTIVAGKSIEEVSIAGKKLGSMPGFSSARQLVRFISTKLGEFEEGSIDAAIAAEFNKNLLVRVYIDDIDRGWAATPRDIENISALINATRDLTTESAAQGNLQFRIALRTDAYNLVRAYDESGDKFEPYKIPLSWSNHDILAIMAKRVSNYFNLNEDFEQIIKLNQNEIASKLDPIIVQKFEGRGHWANRPIHNVLLSLTRKRPRDLVKLLWQAAFFADQDKANRIETHHLESAFPEYSKGRIDDIISEFKSELPEIERVLLSMKPTQKERKSKDKPFQYSNDELISKLSGIAKNHSIHFKNRRAATGPSLAEFLYKIDFIIARKNEEGGIVRFYYEEHDKLQNRFADFGFMWEVHPAYRWALQPTSSSDIFKFVDG